MTRRSSRSRFLLLLLVLTAGTIMTLTYRGHGVSVVASAKSAAGDVFAPVQSALSSAFRPVGDFFRGALDYATLRRQNARLRAELGALQRAELQAPDQQRQLRQLTGLLHLPFAGSLRTIAAQAVQSTSSNFQLALVLDRGTSAGVARGMPVVAGQGLLGRVVQVSADRCTVQLVDDPASSVGVRLGTTGVVGVATGQGYRQPIRVDYIPPSTPVHKGDVMVTSGLQNEIYPAGIPVGRVASAVQRPDSLQEDVSLSPVVDLATVQYVDILRWIPPA